MHINDCSFYFNIYSNLLWVSLRRSWTTVTNMFGSKLLLYIKSQIVRINKVNADIGSDEMSANKKIYDTKQLPIWSVNSPIFWKKNKLILMNEVSRHCIRLPTNYMKWYLYLGNFSKNWYKLTHRTNLFLMFVVVGMCLKTFKQSST